MNDDKHKVSFRVQTKRDTFYYSNTEVVDEEGLQEARSLVMDILDGDHGFISVVEPGGFEVYIPREEIAAVIILKHEAEDE